MKGVKVFIGMQIAALFSFAGLIAYVVHGFDEQRQRDCKQSLESREYRTSTEIATWRDIQEINGSDDPAVVAQFDDLIDRIQARADELPPPVDCVP